MTKKRAPGGARRIEEPPAPAGPVEDAPFDEPLPDPHEPLPQGEDAVAEQADRDWARWSRAAELVAVNPPTPLELLQAEVQALYLRIARLGRRLLRCQAAREGLARRNQELAAALAEAHQALRARPAPPAWSWLLRRPLLAAAAGAVAGAVLTLLALRLRG